MTLLEDLSAFLEPDYNENYWSDDAVLIANDMVTKLQPEDWEKLAASWESRKPGWQRRLADALDTAPIERGMPIITRMLLSSDDSVAIAAVGTLSAYIAQGYPEPISQLAIERIKSLSKLSRIYELSYASLIKRFERNPLPPESE